jgi:hypothetical protein
MNMRASIACGSKSLGQLAHPLLIADGGRLLVHASNITDAHAISHDKSKGNALGGGMYILRGTVDMYQSTIANASVSSNGGKPQGGGVYVASIDATLFICGCTFADAAAGETDSQGGGLFVKGGTISVFDTCFRDCSATGQAAEGGGCFFQGGHLLILDCVIHGAFASGESAKGGSRARQRPKPHEHGSVRPV